MNETIIEDIDTQPFEDHELEIDQQQLSAGNEEVMEDSEVSTTIQAETQEVLAQIADETHTTPVSAASQKNAATPSTSVITPEQDEKLRNDLLEKTGLIDTYPDDTPLSASGISEAPVDTPSTPEEVLLTRIESAPVFSDAPCGPLDLPIIQVKPGELAKALSAAERVLAEAGDYYTRSDRIVCIRFDHLTNKHHVREMSGQDLMVAFAALSKWSRFDKRKGDWTAIDPCPRVCRLLAESWRFSRLKALNGTVTQPYLRPDASVSSEPGYDPKTGILGLFDGDDLDIPLRPNRDEAEHALEVLDDLLSECAFAAAEDRSAALSALLTAAVRPSLPLAPMFHVMAHQSGSGMNRPGFRGGRLV